LLFGVVADKLACASALISTILKVSAEHLGLVEQVVAAHGLLELVGHWPHDLNVDLLQLVQVACQSHTLFFRTKLSGVLEVAHQKRTQLVVVLDGLGVLGARTQLVVLVDVYVAIHLPQDVLGLIYRFVGSRLLAALHVVWLTLHFLFYRPEILL